RIGPETHARAGVTRADCSDFLQRLLYLAVVSEHDAVFFAIAPDFHFEASRQCVGHANADAMQSAGYPVGRILVGLAKFAPRMQRGEDDLHGGDFFLRMHIHRYAASIIADLRRTVLVKR